MLWNKDETYHPFPYSKESELEDAVQAVKGQLFGSNRIYLDDKRKIGAKGKTNNLPDGYIVDLTNAKEPKIFVVENDLSSHQHLKHIAVQILEFSLSFESSKVKVKNVIKQSLQKRPNDWSKCEDFAKTNGYENVDYLLESIIHKKDSFNAMLIIDEVGEELEKVLIGHFRFPVEILTLKRYKSNRGKLLYEFEPFLYDVNEQVTKIEVEEIDTLVVAARDDGFEENFLDLNQWYAIRINATMIPKIKYLAAYQVSPISAITYIAEVASIEQYEETNKYIVYFKAKAEKLKPVKLGKISSKAPQSPRYTSRSRILSAGSLDDVF